MRLRLARIGRSTLPASVALLGVAATSLAVHVTDDVARTSGSTWQRVTLDLAVAALGFGLTFLFARGLDRLIERYQKSEERSRFLEAFAEFLTGSHDFENGIAPLASLLVPLLADECFIDIRLKGGRVRRTTSHGRVSDFDLGAAESLDVTPVVFDDGSGLIVPLRARDRAFGAITLLGTKRGRRFRSGDLEFITGLARQAALALDNARLRVEAERANRMKDEFLATLSHELRTPMNVIIGWLEVLAQEDVDANSRNEILTILERNAKLQVQLIDDLLDVSRLSRGKFVLMIRDEDVAALAHEAFRGLMPAARAKEIDLDISIGPGSHRAPIDADRVRQVLWNILSNAVKFTSAGGRVSLSVETEAESVRVSVKDTGQGIDPAFLPYVFDRFRQEDGSFTRSQGGLGLGLSIASHLVELHGGRLRAESAGRGKGATFIVELRRSPEVSDSRRQESWIAAEI